MNALQQIELGIKSLQESGLNKGTIGSPTAGFCLVGAVNYPVMIRSHHPMDIYDATPAIRVLYDQIVSECERCRASCELWEDLPAQLVWRHNDDHVESTEDAILLLKRTAHEL